MDQALGLIELAFYVAAVVAFAGIMTWAVIKLFPTKDRPSKPGDASGDGGTPVGRLFRRAKREATG